MKKLTKTAMTEIRQGRKPTKAELIWALKTFVNAGGLRKKQ